MSLDVSIMIEGQDGINWPRWQAIARAVEAGGFFGLYRSDHFTTHRGPAHDALETWASLTWLASNTRRIHFGPLVSPVSLRNPVVLALTAAAVDDLSGGRLELGLGAGWQEREHRAFGFELAPLKERFDRFEEALEVVYRLLRSDEPVSFPGSRFHLDEALLTPRPARAGGPPIVIGGKGGRRSLDFVARFADEWNTTGVDIPGFQKLAANLDARLDARGRPPGAVRRSLMTTVVFGRDDAEFRRRLGDRDVHSMYKNNRIVGTPRQVADQLSAWHEGGLDRVMLRWEDFDDADGIQAMGESLLPLLGH